jgi:hypothetical protein
MAPALILGNKRDTAPGSVAAAMPDTWAAHLGALPELVGVRADSATRADYMSQLNRFSGSRGL